MVLNGSNPLIVFVDAIFGSAADRVIVRFTRRRHLKMPPIANNYNSICLSLSEADRRVKMGNVGISRIDCLFINVLGKLTPVALLLKPEH